MPRIRKKTSNRQNTRDRAKIRKKVSESNKKTKRDSKRSTTWKSKKKDLGIPNSFHLKDQVLAELAEEKRRNEEAKLARKVAASASKALAPVPGEVEDDTPGISSIGSKVLSATSAEPIALAGPSKGKNLGEEEDVPALIDTALGSLQDVMDRADVVLQVVDARDVMGGRSAMVESMITEAEGKLVVLVNKADLVPRELLASWLNLLPPHTHLFSTPLSLGPSELLSYLSSLTPKTPDEPIIAALMGLPSVGKTSILNSLLSLSSSSSSKASVHKVAPSVPLVAGAKNPEPTTKAPVEVAVNHNGKEIRLIDTPGWEFAEDVDNEDDEEEDQEEENDEETKDGDEAKVAKWDLLESRLAGDLLRRNLGRVDRVKDVFPLANYIVSRSNAQDLMMCYNVPYFQQGDVDAFLTALARVNGRVKKHGEPDLESAARILLRDWAHNIFPYYCTPPKPTLANGNTTTSIKVDEAAEKAIEAMSKVLEKLKSRKEMRSSGKGLVRFKSGEVDSRDVILDDDYTALAGALDDDDEDDGEDDEDDDEEEGEVEGSDDEEEEEELDSEAERFLEDAANGEEVQLEDGSEPPSVSDVDDDEEEEESEEEEEIPEPVKPGRKNKRKATESPKIDKKRAKRVSFGAPTRFQGVSAVAAGDAGKSGSKRKRENAGEDDEGVKGILKSGKSVKAVAPVKALPKKGSKKARV